MIGERYALNYDTSNVLNRNNCSNGMNDVSKEERNIFFCIFRSAN